jgi:HSP20 family protein
VTRNRYFGGEPSEASAPERTPWGRRLSPRVDVAESDDAITLYAEVPGVRPEDVDLRFEEGELTLLARRRPRHQGEYLRQEARDGDFFRVFAIGEAVDAGGIEAVCKDGLLTVRLPKREAVRPRQVNVRGG